MENTRYFIAKSANMQGLRTAMDKSMWACNDRKFPPQPRDILAQALHNSDQVVLIFSVNNCHGWHGYAKMLGLPGSIKNPTIDQTRNGSPQIETNIIQESSAFQVLSNSTCDHENNFDEKQDTKDSVNEVDAVWHRFPIEWQCIFLKDHGEKCLPSTETERFLAVDKTQVNKARNFQEIVPHDGQEMCKLMRDYQSILDHLKQKKTEEKIAKQPAPFFTPSSHNVDEVWNELLDKVEVDLGKVLIACPFGSQRYNLSTPDSDMDMFVVYQAATHKLLGFEPPPHTVKSREGEACDYTIHEVHRFCQLLIGGDPRCTELLFLEPSTVHVRSDLNAWNQLCKEKQCFLNRNLLEKYLNDAKGAKGIKQLNKILANDPVSVSQRVRKMAYIIIRLLQNASDVAHAADLRVFRQPGTTEHTLLVHIRTGQVNIPTIKEEINRLICNIEAGDIKNNSERIQQVKESTEKWLLGLRYTDFVKHPNI